MSIGYCNFYQPKQSCNSINNCVMSLSGKEKAVCLRVFFFFSFEKR